MIFSNRVRKHIFLAKHNAKTGMTLKTCWVIQKTKYDMALFLYLNVYTRKFTREQIKGFLG